jgi:peptidoglycan/LPS O-acetylase OafA/YrhL
VHAGRIPWLDGWRGLSLLLVLVGHFVPDANFGLAKLGVELFFVLSGRLIADILFVEREALPTFFVRRISRVYPGLAVFVLATWVATLPSPYAFKPLAAAAGLTFTLNYAMVLQHGVEAIENLWSLCIEEHGYLLLAGLAILARRGVPAGLAIAAIALLSIVDAAVSSLALGQDYRTVYWRTDAHVASILVGALAYLALRGRAVGRWVPLAAFAAGLGFWAVGPDVVRYSLATACMAVSVTTLERAPGPALRALSWRPLIWAGLCSYSIYLWQQPFARLWFDGRLPALAACGLAIVFGLVSYRWVERPARRYINARWARLRPRIVPDPPRAAAPDSPAPAAPSPTVAAESHT